jgi:hypothetical protein
MWRRVVWFVLLCLTVLHFYTFLSKAPETNRRIVFSTGASGKIHHTFVYRKYPDDGTKFPIGWSYTKAVHDPELFNVYFSDDAVMGMTAPELKELMKLHGIDKEDTVWVIKHRKDQPLLLRHSKKPLRAK